MVTTCTFPDAGSFDDFCVREREYTLKLTAQFPAGCRRGLTSPKVSGGGFPEFPLPLGQPAGATSSDMTSEILMDTAQCILLRLGLHRCWRASSSAACSPASPRWSTSLRVLSRITGLLRFHARPRKIYDAGVVYRLDPDHRPDRRGLILSTAAWAAQASFDSGLDMAEMPYYRVLELAPWLSWPRPNFPVLNFFHGGAAPLNAILLPLTVTLANNVGTGLDG